MAAESKTVSRPRGARAHRIMERDASLCNRDHVHELAPARHFADIGEVVFFGKGLVLGILRRHDVGQEIIMEAEIIGVSSGLLDADIGHESCDCEILDSFCPARNSGRFPEIRSSRSVP